MPSQKFNDVYSLMGKKMESIKQKAGLIKKLNELTRPVDTSDLTIKFKSSLTGEIVLFSNHDIDDMPTIQEMGAIMSSIQEVIKTMIAVREEDILELAKEIGTLEEQYNTKQATQFIRESANVPG